MWLLCNPLTFSVSDFDLNHHATKILQQCWTKLLLYVLQWLNMIHISTISSCCFDQLPEFSNTKMFYYANTYNVLLGHSKSWPHARTIGRNIHATFNTWTSPQIRELTRDYANISTKGLKVKVALKRNLMCVERLYHQNKKVKPLIKCFTSLSKYWCFG